MKEHYARLSQLDLDGSSRWIEGHLSAARYLTTSVAGDQGLKHVDFETIQDFWRAVSRSELPVLSDVRLHDVQISEWVPISPGLSSILETSATMFDEMQPIGFEANSGDDPVAIYEPEQKAEFVRAGYGCVRFGPHSFGSKASERWLLCATSTSFAHDGLPIAATDDIYRVVIDGIRREGRFSCTLSGRLEWLPDRFIGGRRAHDDYDLIYDRPFLKYSRVPRLFLSITNLEYHSDRSRDPLVATMAASFIGRVTDHGGFYVAFASFDPGRVDSLTKARTWLFERYIRDRYDGTIVTDCDEQHPSPDAGISLARVMSGDVDLGAIRRVVYVSRDPSSRYRHQLDRPSPWELHSKLSFIQRATALSGYSVQEISGDLVMGDQYRVEQAAAVGPQSMAIAESFSQSNLRSGIDLQALALELATLREAVVSQVKSADEAIAYGALAEGEKAAQEGDTAALEGALRRAGKWILDKAIAIGVPLAVEALRRARGIVST
jgi:hypothetical protein